MHNQVYYTYMYIMIHAFLKWLIIMCMVLYVYVVPVSIEALP